MQRFMFALVAVALPVAAVAQGGAMPTIVQQDYSVEWFTAHPDEAAEAAGWCNGHSIPDRYVPTCAAALTADANLNERTGDEIIRQAKEAKRRAGQRQ